MLCQKSLSFKNIFIDGIVDELKTGNWNSVHICNISEIFKHMLMT